MELPPPPSSFFFFVALFLLLVTRNEVSAATVTSPNDDGGPTTLRSILLGAAAFDTIDFSSNVTLITLTMGPLTSPATDLTIDGGGNVTIDGSGARCFDIIFLTNVLNLKFQSCSIGLNVTATASDSQVTSTSISNGQVGIYVAAQVTIDGCQIWSHTDKNVHLISTSTSSVVKNTIIGLDPSTGLCPVGVAQTYGVYVDQTSGLLLDTLTVSCNQYQIYVNGAYSTQVSTSYFGFNIALNQVAHAFDNSDAIAYFEVISFNTYIYSALTVLPMEFYQSTNTMVYYSRFGTDASNVVFPLTVRGAPFTKDAALYAESSQISVSYSFFDSSSTHGITLNKCTGASISSNDLGLYAGNNGNAINIFDCEPTTLININDIYSNTGWGVYVDQTSELSTISSTHVKISRNNIGALGQGNQMGGIYVLNAVGVNVSRNTIQYNNNVGVVIAKSGTQTKNPYSVGIPSINQVISCNPSCSFPGLPIDIDGDSAVLNPGMNPPTTGPSIVKYPLIVGLVPQTFPPVIGTLWNVTVELTSSYYFANTNYELDLFTSDQDPGILNGDGQTSLNDPPFALSTDSSGGVTQNFVVIQPASIALNLTCVSGRLTLPTAFMTLSATFPSTSELSPCFPTPPTSSSATVSLSTSISVSNSLSISAIPATISATTSESATISITPANQPTNKHRLGLPIKCHSESDCKHKLKEILHALEHKDDKCLDIRDCGWKTESTDCFEKNPQNCDVLPMIYTVSEYSRASIPIMTTDGYILAQLELPPYIFLKETQIEITMVFPGDNDAKEDVEKKLNGEKMTITSGGMVRIKVFDKNGGQVTKFKTPLCLWMITKIESRNKMEKECMGWTNEDKSSWFCDSDFDTTISFDDNLFAVKSCYDHVTTFAVLFQQSGGSFGTGGPGNILWIISVSLLGGIPILMFLIALIATRFEYGRRIIYGYERGHSLDDTLKKLEKVAHQNLSVDAKRT